MDIDLAVLIVGALKTIGTLSVDELAREGIKKSYKALADAIKQKYGNKANLELVEEDPDSSARLSVLRENISKWKIDTDGDVIALAKNLQELLHPVSGSMEDFSQDGHRNIANLIVGSSNSQIFNTGVVELHMAATNIVQSGSIELVRNLVGHTYHINALSVCNNILASGGGDRRIILWDLISSRTLSAFEHDSWVGAVLLCQNYLVASSGKGSIKVWDYKTKQELLTKHGHVGPIRGLASLANERIASAGADGKVKIWSLPELELLDTYEYHQAEIRRIVPASIENSLFSGDSQGNIFSLDLSTKKVRRIIALEIETMVRSLAFSEQSHLLGVTTSKGEVVVWDTRNQAVKWRVQGHMGHAIAIAFHPSLKLVATGGQDKLIRLWSSEDGTLLESKVAHEEDITGLVFARKGDWLVSSSRDKKISIWRRD